MTKLWVTRAELRRMIAGVLSEDDENRGAVAYRGTVPVRAKKRPETPVMKADVARSGYARNDAPEPAYSKKELRQGADIESTKPGVIDRVKNMFGFGKKPGADASLGNVNDLRAEFERYKKMHHVAEISRNVKKAAYAKKQMQRAHQAWRDAGGTK